MQSKFDELKGIHFLRLLKGEDVIGSIINYCKEKNLTSGTIYGLGAVSKASLGYYDLETKIYLENKFEFNAELLNCTGNISKNEETGDYIPHLHMIIGDRDGNTFGGHVMPDTIISVTGEFVIFEMCSTISRKLDGEFNLFLLNLQ
ncbi:MAG: DNA-binding protein [Candidatus Heimdallarchaeota archaeon]|nr:DNA-binding protein [Candidatus Heimdallarchaeota archaeon]